MLESIFANIHYAFLKWSVERFNDVSICAIKVCECSRPQVRSLHVPSIKAGADEKSFASAFYFYI